MKISSTLCPCSTAVLFENDDKYEPTICCTYASYTAHEFIFQSGTHKQGKHGKTGKMEKTIPCQGNTWNLKMLPKHRENTWNNILAHREKHCGTMVVVMVVVCMIHSQKARECTIWLLDFQDLSMNINNRSKANSTGKICRGSGKNRENTWNLKMKFVWVPNLT